MLGAATLASTSRDPFLKARATMVTTCFRYLALIARPSTARSRGGNWEAQTQQPPNPATRTLADSLINHGNGAAWMAERLEHPLSVCEVYLLVEWLVELILFVYCFTSQQHLRSYNLWQCILNFASCSTRRLCHQHHDPISRSVILFSH